MAVPSAVHGTPATADTGVKDGVTAMPFSHGAMWHPTMLLAQGTYTPTSPVSCPASHAAPHEPPCPICHPAPCQPHSPVFPSPHGLSALWPQAPASTSSWNQSPTHVWSQSLPQPSEVPSPLCSQQCWRGTAPQSPQGCPGPRGQQHPPPSAWHVGPASWHVPHPWGDTPGAGVLAAGSPRIGDRLIKCVILNYPDKSIRAFKVNSLNIIMKRAFLCSR